MYEGYPACAGIDRQTATGLPPSLWLPRMRGDRPYTLAREACQQLATPHARGSTHDVVISQKDAGGYPACAGIDPQKTFNQVDQLGLPRMRGDRPRKGGETGPIRVATPHARGSTGGENSQKKVSTGYPACAGIDPP